MSRRSVLGRTSRRIRGHVAEEVSAVDFVDVPAGCPYQVGDHVLL